MRTKSLLGILALVAGTVWAVGAPAGAPGGPSSAAAAFGHCGPDQVPPGIDQLPDYLPPGTLIGNVYVGDICNWHDRCNVAKDRTGSGYNCNWHFSLALHKRCADRWGN